jgi:hypothetical protein
MQCIVNEMIGIFGSNSISLFGEMKKRRFFLSTLKSGKYKIRGEDEKIMKS